MYYSQIIIITLPFGTQIFTLFNVFIDGKYTQISNLMGKEHKLIIISLQLTTK